MPRDQTRPRSNANEPNETASHRKMMTGIVPTAITVVVTCHRIDVAITDGLDRHGDATLLLPLVTHGPYLSAVETGHNKEICKFTSLSKFTAALLQM